MLAGGRGRWSGGAWKRAVRNEAGWLVMGKVEQEPVKAELRS